MVSTADAVGKDLVVLPPNVTGDDKTAHAVETLNVSETLAGGMTAAAVDSKGSTCFSSRVTGDDEAGTLHVGLALMAVAVEAGTKTVAEDLSFS